MPHAAFVHLRVHSAYSLSEGAIKLKELIKLCHKHAMPAVAVTDTGNLFGALEFSLAAAEAGIQPIIGCQIGLRRDAAAANGHSAGGPPGPASAPDQLVLLVQTETGWRNLMKLVSRSFLNSEPGTPPQIGLADLEGRAAGLIALTGGPTGPLGRLLAEGQQAAAAALLERLRGLFGDRLYVELMRHGPGEIGAREDRIEPLLIELADAHGLPLVATNDCFFADEDMFEAHDALLCIAEGACVSETARRRLTPEHRFKSAAEMRALFADLPEAVDNTIVIARRCSFLLRKIDPILPPYRTEDGRDEAAELRLQAAEGLEHRLAASVLAATASPEERLSIAKPYRERLEYELEVITGMGFAGYFLIVSDFMKWTRRQEIPVGVRGSGATSVVAWSLDITSLDPLRFGLLFERFLNPERVSMPDFDIDFCQERRDEVIDYVRRKYGHDRVAQIITFGKLQARAVLRDVGRVLQMPYGQVDRICKLVPNNPANPVTLQEAVEGEPVLKEMRRTDEAVARLIGIALKLEGLYRHASTHAAGVVISDRPLDELVPLYRDPGSDMPVTQFNMKYVEMAGLVKFDFLGLKTLTIIAKAQALLAARGNPVDVAAVPFDDAPTYAMLGHGDSTGVFQLESSGMRDLLRKMRPDRIEDLIALVALYRPGPMESIPRYTACKHGQEQPHYLHQKLEPILKETFGVMTYQEDVMMIARVLAGYSLGQADLLRRAMGKKIKAEMDAHRAQFLQGAVAGGVETGVANEIFDQAAKFAGYGFNKGHAAAYAQVAYQTAYLKANHAVEFFAATMTLDLGNTDKLNVLRQELARLKIRLLGPDINLSGAVFTVEQPACEAEGEPGAIRYALAAIKGVGLQAMEAVTAERGRGGPFRDLFDFARRIDARVVNKRQLENLAAAGAFDSLDPNRAQVHAAVETILRYAQAVASDRDSGMASLFDGSAAPALRAPKLPTQADWDSLERLRREFEAIGFYLSAHPLDGYGRTLARLGVVSSAGLRAAAASGDSGSTRFRMAGIVVARQERTARSGNRFAFVQLSDAAGVFEATLFSETLAVARPLLEPGTPVLVTVDVQQQGEDLRLTAQQVFSLEQEVAQAAEGVRVFVSEAGPVAGLCSTLQRVGHGRGRVSVVVALDRAREVEIALPGGWAMSASGRAAIKAIPGVVDVHDL